MQRTILRVLTALFAVSSVAVAFAQSGMGSKAATYITAEEVTAVNKLPGVDRTIKVVDIGGEHFSVGIVHRGPTGAAARGAGGGAGGGNAAAGGAGRGAAPAGEPCGVQATTPPPAGTATGISHDSQTEGYYIVSGGGTVVTGGHVVNGRKSGPDAEVTKLLNGPSCSGFMVGSDVVKKVVKTGDIIIIPAGVPHGWIDITDHVDYLSFRPSGQILEAGYVNPAIKH
jgi:mannose-6-phosphate isomerase-like protein (cupin superfamily)